MIDLRQRREEEERRERQRRTAVNRRISFIFLLLAALFLLFRLFGPPSKSPQDMSPEARDEYLASLEAAQDHLPAEPQSGGESAGERSN